jgi:hypothetical protein
VPDCRKQQLCLPAGWAHPVSVEVTHTITKSGELVNVSSFAFATLRWGIGWRC